ncbi:MAG: hypothetical protein LBJ10_05875 [Clostridiales bacterium]|jgi:hypothetical protein|nr:hypothetical protein [Clostridiales bacterium]
MDINEPLVTPAEIRLNASHLRQAGDETLEAVIADVHEMHIIDALARWQGDPRKAAKLRVLEKLLAQHMATLDIRRADSEGGLGLSKSISVPKGMGLAQTEYGQTAKALAGEIPVELESGDRPARVEIL